MRGALPATSYTFCHCPTLLRNKQMVFTQQKDPSDGAVRSESISEGEINHFRCSDAPSREYWGHNGDPGELRTQFGVHQAATEVVFLKANVTLLNDLEAWVSSPSHPVLSEAEKCPHLYFLFVMEMCPHLHFLPELEICPHLHFSSPSGHVWEGLCPA